MIDSSLNDQHPITHIYTKVGESSIELRRWLVRVVGGCDQGASLVLDRGSLLVGTDAGNDLVLQDPRVSRSHLELRLLEGGLQVRDLGSSNGTFYGASRLGESVLEGATVLRLGDTELALEPVLAELPAEEEVDHLGDMVGCSSGMRQLFGCIHRIAPTGVNVLVEGETGTGKELVAKEIHHRSQRADRPFVVVDCGSLPSGLVESELFGHIRGAFTGALSDRDGAFALADGGTIFLDELGELPLDLQPKLLRVLEQHQIRRVGDNQLRKVDVRVTAATCRDLSEEVAKGRFRADLYYRIAVVCLHIPPLRSRLDDLPQLVERLASDISGHKMSVPESVIERLAQHSWPGNVRELRNVISHAVALHRHTSVLELPQVLGVQTPPMEHMALSSEWLGDYRLAKRRAVDAFEEQYLRSLLERNSWNVSAAAREAGVDRNYLYRLMKRHGFRRE